MKKQYVYEIVDTGERFLLDYPPKPGSETKEFQMEFTDYEGLSVLEWNGIVKYIGVSDENL